MSVARIDLPPFEFVSIGEGTKCGGLKCRNSEISKWFKSRARKDHLSGSVRVTCVVERGRPHRPLGFYALATVAEEVSTLPGIYHRFRTGAHFSALQLVWLATDTTFEGQGLGSIMVGQVIRLFAQIGPVIGLPHLIVIPAAQDYDRLTNFYAKRNFVPYKGGEAMFLSLPFAMDAVEKAEKAMARTKGLA